MLIERHTQEQIGIYLSHVHITNNQKLLLTRLTTMKKLRTFTFTGSWHFLTGFWSNKAMCLAYSVSSLGTVYNLKPEIKWGLSKTEMDILWHYILELSLIFIIKPKLICKHLYIILTIKKGGWQTETTVPCILKHQFNLQHYIWLIFLFKL